MSCYLVEIHQSYSVHRCRAALTYPALIHGDRFRDQKLSNVATHVETCTIIVLLMIFKYILTEPGIYKCE